MFDYTIKRGAVVEMEIYGTANFMPHSVEVLCMHDRHFNEESLTDDFEEDGESFYVFSTVALECPQIPCGIGLVVNVKDVIKN
jgi:hypothetical protein